MSHIYMYMYAYTTHTDRQTLCYTHMFLMEKLPPLEVPQEDQVTQL